MSRARDEARIREVLIALGGSPEALDRGKDQAVDEPVTLASRIAANTRLTSAARRAPIPFADELTTEPLAVTSAEPVPKPELVPRPPVRREQAAGPSRSRLAFNRGRRSAAVQVRRLVVQLAALARYLARKLIDAALAAAGGLMLALARAKAALTRPPRPARRVDERREEASVAVVATPQLRPRPQRRQSWKSRSIRSRPPPRTGLALAAAVVVVVPVTLVSLLHRHQAGAAQAQRQPTTVEALSGAEAAVPVRTAFSNPAAYAAAMTRLSLRSGGTQIDGDPSCQANSTGDRWTCLARGKPTLGAYAGHWLTYRCSPSSTPQPGGQPPAVMISCTPENPPALT